MRQIDELIIHCTATPEGREITVKQIDAWHKARGWKGIGYHKVVHLDGSVSEGRPESTIGAHAKGHNRYTIGYVYVGGVDRNMKAKDTRTAAQKKTLERLAGEAVHKYGLKKISGHRDYAAKACPSFDARAEYSHLLHPVPQPPQRPAQPRKPAPVLRDSEPAKPAPVAKSGGWWAWLKSFFI